MNWIIVLVFVCVLSNATVYYLTRKKYETVKLTEVNGMLSEILETNFRNNSLSNAAESILIILKRFYKIDYITILIRNEKSGMLDIISSNAPNGYLKSLEMHCNKMFKDINTFSAKVSSSDGVHPLPYASAGERGICFSNFTPLEYDEKVIGGVLLENKQINSFSNNRKRKALYKKIFNNTALVLQNVIYTENLISMTSTDQLTGVYNRRFIDMTLQEQLSIHRNLGMSFSVVIFDIDYFKKFNDTYGHAFGDLVLKEVAEFMKNNLNEKSWIARYGGEEFVLFFGRSELNTVYKQVETLREGLSNLQLTNGDITTSVTSSFGIASYPTVDGSANDLIEKADAALYESKRNGRNRVTIYKQTNVV